jgi:hypothetical protein
MRQDRRQAAEPPAPTGNPRQDRENSRSNRIPREPGYLARDLTSQRAAIGDYQRQAEKKPPGLARPRKGWPGPGCIHPDAHSKDRVSDALPAASSSGAMAVLERRPPSISGHDGSGPGGGSRPVMAAMAVRYALDRGVAVGAADGLGLAVPAALAGRENPTRDRTRQDARREWRSPGRRRARRPEPGGPGAEPGTKVFHGRDEPSHTSSRSFLPVSTAKSCSQH